MSDAKIDCPRCMARFHNDNVAPCGEIICSSCKGEGRTYLGNGETSDCARCDGEGATACPTCGGSGKTDDLGAAAYLLIEDD